MKLQKQIIIQIWSLLICNLICIPYALQEESSLQFKEVTFLAHEKLAANCTLYELSRISNHLGNVGIYCALVCFNLDDCVYFVVEEELDLNCLLCTNNPLQALLWKDSFNVWSGQVNSLTKFWRRKYNYIGSDIVGGDILDKALNKTLVDGSPVSARLKLYSFLYKAGAVNKTIIFGIYRRYDDTACHFELIHQWMTVNHKLGLNEYVVSDYVVEKGDHIGFTWPHEGVVLYNKGSSMKYCFSHSAIQVSRKYAFDELRHERSYAFQAKLIPI